VLLLEILAVVIDIIDPLGLGEIDEAIASAGDIHRVVFVVPAGLGSLGVIYHWV